MFLTGTKSEQIGTETLFLIAFRHFYRNTFCSDYRNISCSDKTLKFLWIRILCSDLFRKCSGANWS